MSSGPAPAPHHVRREEVLDWQSYADDRDTVRAAVMELKKSRRIHLGENLTFLFENHDTIWYQIVSWFSNRNVRFSPRWIRRDFLSSMTAARTVSRSSA